MRDYNFAKIAIFICTDKRKRFKVMFKKISWNLLHLTYKFE